MDNQSKSDHNLSVHKNLQEGEITLFHYFKFRNGGRGSVATGIKLIKKITEQEAAVLGVELKSTKNSLRRNKVLTLEQVQEASQHMPSATVRNKFLRAMVDEGFIPVWGSKYLYLMRTIDTYYKIGVSDNPNKRLIELQTGCPAPLFLEAVWRVSELVQITRRVPDRNCGNYQAGYEQGGGSLTDASR